MGTSSKSLLAKLTDLARVQGGYFTTKQAVSAGYVDSVHGYHVRNGDWVKVLRGIYRLAEMPEPAWPELVAFSLWSRDREEVPQGVFAMETAMAIHGVVERNGDKIQMIVPKSFRRNSEIPDRLELHKDDLEASEIERKDGFLVTTLERTVRDIKAICTNPKILAAIAGIGKFGDMAHAADTIPAAEDPSATPAWGEKWEEVWAGAANPLPASGPRSFNDVINAGED